jgi:hypothetical protein
MMHENKLGPGPSAGWVRPVHQNGFCLVSGHEPINKIGFDLLQPQLIIASAGPAKRCKSGDHLFAPKYITVVS